MLGEYSEKIKGSVNIIKKVITGFKVEKTFEVIQF